MKKSWKILISVSAGLIILAAVIIGLITVKENLTMKKRKLESYSCEEGGDMRGSSYSESVRWFEDRVVLTVSSADSYNADPEVSEYYIDEAVFTDLKDVFQNYHMKRWQKRKITKMFVADGSSTGYDFDFGEESFHFSSQLYPGKYGRGVHALGIIIDQYKAEGEKLPGLVVEEDTNAGGDEYAGDGYAGDEPEEDLPEEVTLEVFEYSERKLHYRLINGTAEEVTFTTEVLLKNADTGEEIPIEASPYDDEETVYTGQNAEKTAVLEAFLSAGNYVLTSGAYSAAFEIR